MTRFTLSLAALAAALAAVLAAPLAVSARPAARAASATTISTRHTSRGTLLTDARGFTLYAFTKDGRNRDRCVTTPGCAHTWPPVTTSGGVVAGRGVQRALLGTIRISGGRRQVTYAGHALYRYSLDPGPAQTGYLGVSSFGGTWKAVRPSGSEIG